MDTLVQPSTPDALSQIREPKLGRLYEYWTKRKGSQRLPARRDIDPLDFSYILGSIMLLDVLDDPLRFRVSRSRHRIGKPPVMISPKSSSTICRSRTIDLTSSSAVKK